MEDTQSAATESETTCDEHQSRLRMSSFIDTLKAGREVLSHLLEMIERWYKEETTTTDQSETTEQGKDDLERLAEKRSEMEKELDSLTAAINRKAKSLDLDVSIQEITSKIDSLKSEHSTLMSTRERTSTQRLLKKKDDAIEECKKKLKQLEEEKDDLERLAENRSEMKKELDSLVEEINRKTNRTSAQTEKDNALEEWKKKSKQLEEENSKLREDVKEEKEAKGKFKKKVEEIEGLKNEHQREVDKLSQEIQTMKEKLSEESDHKQKVYEDSKKSLTDLKCRNDALLKELEEKEEKINHYTQRLASLSEKRVKQDQRFVEDATSVNRPSELEKDFKAFFDDERLDACEKMQSIYQKKEEIFIYIYYPRLACIIFEIAYEVVKESKEAACDLFRELLKVMIDRAPEMGKDFIRTKEWWRKEKYPFGCVIPIAVNMWADGSPYPKDITDSILMTLKETADTCQLDSLEERVSAEAYEKWREWRQKDKSCMFEPTAHLIPSLNKYIKDCLRLTWKMVTQVPPMKLEFHSIKFDKSIHENMGYRGSSHSSARKEHEEEIDCYLWPGLQDGGGRSIRKAEVICKMK